jgi:ribosomal protein S15P/S13E
MNYLFLGLELQDILTVYSLAVTGFGGIFMWVSRDRFFQKSELKKADIEVKKEELDYAKDTRDYFLSRETDLKTEKEELKEEFKLYRDEAKAEREYYREKQGELRLSINNLQDKFDKMALNYALEVEKSEKWMQKFFQMEKENKDLKDEVSTLTDKYETLERHHEELKKDHDALKKLVDKQKLNK